MLADNRIEKEEAKKETPKKKSTKDLCLKKNLKLFRNTKTPCTAYRCIPMNNPCS